LQQAFLSDPSILVWEKEDKPFLKDLMETYNGLAMRHSTDLLWVFYFGHQA
jgi:hypothetical protein